MTALLIGIFLGLGLTILGFILMVKSEAPSTRSWIAAAMLLVGIATGMGSCAIRARRICNSFEAEWMALDSGRVRFITLGPSYPGAVSDSLQAELFPSPVRIVERQVIADLVRELKGPPDNSRGTAKAWACRLDLDLGDHELSCRIMGRPADWKIAGTTIQLVDADGRTLVNCHSRRRDSLGTMLEGILLKQKDHP